MPHLTIQYSANCDADFDALCTALAQTMRETGLFPLGGIRVRAHSVGHYAIADEHEGNAFVDLVLRMGAGRSAEQKRAAGEAIMDRAKAFFAPALAEPHFMLALEIIEIDAEFSWKTNTIHARLS